MDHGRVFVPHYTCLSEIKIKFRNTSTHPLKNQHVEFQSYKINGRLIHFVQLGSMCKAHNAWHRVKPQEMVVLL